MRYLAADVGGTFTDLVLVDVDPATGAGRMHLDKVSSEATGSAAGPLACHLARHGLIAFGEEIEISQGAELNRPSTLYARAEGTRDRLERVEVGGSAVVVARGEFRV